ncbi:hypothetical protein NQF87_08470 [Bombella sp. TMW 2.2559]|uniref:Uncharacterized protein n=1 Tax=Bombella dulcis TaxID=2967339 RepID=A0ABT3WD40_9PROT|nr:hypothetical protein [Bombella dulcis]MCX5617000.1 hypothetical protein [Bombella dulcis]
MRIIVTRIGIVLSLVLGLLGTPLAAQADTINDLSERLMQAMRDTEEQDYDSNAADRVDQIKREFDNKISEIAKKEGSKARAALKKAIIAWMAYQKAMGKAVKASHSESGGDDGAVAVSHFNAMTSQELLKILDQFFPKHQ